MSNVSAEKIKDFLDKSILYRGNSDFNQGVAEGLVAVRTMLTVTGDDLTQVAEQANRLGHEVLDDEEGQFYEQEFPYRLGYLLALFTVHPISALADADFQDYV